MTCLGQTQTERLRWLGLNEPELSVSIFPVWFATPLLWRNKSAPKHVNARLALVFLSLQSLQLMSKL
jgi:hypothetical protein